MTYNKEQAVRKNLLVEHALDLFASQGYEKTTVSQIAKSSGVAKGLVYYYFDSKDEILESVAEYVCTLHVDRLESKMEKNTYDFYERLLLLMDAYYDIHPYTKTQTTLTWSDNSIFAEVFHRVYLERIDDILNGIVKQGEDEGILDLKYPKQMIVMTMEGIFGLTRYRELNRDLVIMIIEQSLNLPHGTLKIKGARLFIHFEKEGGDSVE